MQELLVLNVVLIICAFFAGILFSDSRDDGVERFMVGVGLAWIVMWISFWVWVIYVAVHFITKYW